MQLHKILANINDCDYSHVFRDKNVLSITSDSRFVVMDSLFIALRGSLKEGSHFIQDAIVRGASVIVAENFEHAYGSNICCVKVKDTKLALRVIARNFYGDPSAIIRTVGITGTNGKTTITYLLENLFRVWGKATSVIGTINHRIKDKVYPSSNTTPGFLDNQKFLAHLVDEKVNYCFMEVSSHALDQGRVDSIDFKQAVFTNLTSDHLDYHKTRENYFLAKAKLFVNLKSDATAIINGDDEYGLRLKSLTKAKTLLYGIQNDVDIKAVDIKLSVDKSEFNVMISGAKHTFQTPLIGMHNIYNILAVIGVGVSEGLPISTIQKAIAGFNHVPGRLERVNIDKNFSVFIDYAHTEDALLNVLRTIRQVSSSRLIVVFGCGGDRDRTKRPKMARVVSEWADQAIVTSDNPRTEDPQTIIDEICTGFLTKNFTVVVDRKEAIARALSMVNPGDIILIAGKGHETYQIFKDKTIDFDERIVIQEILKNEN